MLKRPPLTLLRKSRPSQVVSRSAVELGVSLTAVYQWSTGYTLTAQAREDRKAEKVLGRQPGGYSCAKEGSPTVCRTDAGFVGEGTIR